MRALLLNSYDGPDGLRLGDVDEPVADDASVILDIRAIGINFPDLLATKGQYPHTQQLPYVPGCEVAGVVHSAPEGCGLHVGAEASAFIWDGGYAELARVPLGWLAPIPAGVSFETAAAMMVNYHTAHFALARRARVASGETVLVMGAAGGIGTAALQVATGLGARVIAGVANEQQRATSASAGAGEIVVLQEGFASGVRELTDGRGVDVVVDPLGDWLFLEATRALAPEGRILVVGFAAGAIPELRVNRLLLKNIAAVGVAWGAFLGVDPDLVADAAESLNAMLVSGVVRPEIGMRCAFEEIPQALRSLERHEIAGKAVALGATPRDPSVG